MNLTVNEQLFPTKKYYDGQLFTTKLLAKRIILFGIIRIKKVRILSSKHKRIKINDDRKGISETVAYYNKTKFGVDITDQMTRNSFNILNLVGINSWILYKETRELTKEYHEFIQEEKENLQGISNGQGNISHCEKHARYDCTKKIKQLHFAELIKNMFAITSYNKLTIPAEKNNIYYIKFVHRSNDWI
ncbi:piggyBac transposable element-derived protein 4-like, partial [Vespula maculifrons]